MKVRMTIDFKMPEKFADFTEEQLRSIFYTEVVEIVHQAHKERMLELDDARDQHAIALTESGCQECTNILQILDHAKDLELEWMGITDVPEWWIERC